METSKLKDNKLGVNASTGIKDAEQGYTTAWAVAQQTVQVRVQNETGGPVTIAAADWTVQVLKQ
jgi:hypothetical protein